MRSGGGEHRDATTSLVLLVEGVARIVSGAVHVKSDGDFIGGGIAHLVDALRVVDVADLAAGDRAVANEFEGFVVMVLVGQVGEREAALAKSSLETLDPARAASVIVDWRALALVPAEEKDSEGGVVRDERASVLGTVEASEVGPFLLVDVESLKHVEDTRNLLRRVRERNSSQRFLQTQKQIANRRVNTTIESARRLLRLELKIASFRDDCLMREHGRVVAEACRGWTASCSFDESRTTSVFTH